MELMMLKYILGLIYVSIILVTIPTAYS